MHVRADRGDRRPLALCRVGGQQRRRCLFRTFLSQSHHLAPDNVREHGPEALAFPGLDLIEPNMPRAMFGRMRSHSAKNASSARRALLQLTPWRTAA